MSVMNSTQWLLSQNKYNVSHKKSKVISIISGKGGVGKTSISLALAKTLSDDGKKVLLIDCDYNLSNAIIRLGLPLDNSFYDLICGHKKFEECIKKWNSIDLLSGCNGSIDLFSSKFNLELSIVEIIEEVRNQYDFILLDCPAGLDKVSLFLNSFSNERIVVVNPESSSITDAYSIMKILNIKYGVKSNKLLFNKVTNSKKVTKMYNGLQSTILNFLDCRVVSLGNIPYLEGDDPFDCIFKNKAKNSTSEHFNKIVKSLTEEFRAYSSTKNLYENRIILKKVKNEQEVQRV